MKAHIIMSYNPDCDQDSERIRTMLKAGDYRRVIEDFLQDVLRPVIKHEDDEVKVAHYERIRSDLFDIIHAYEVEIS